MIHFNMVSGLFLLRRLAALPSAYCIDANESTLKMNDKYSVKIHRKAETLENRRFLDR